MIEHIRHIVHNSHLEPIDGGVRRVTDPSSEESFAISVDEEKLMRLFADRCAHSKTGKTTLGHGAIKITHRRNEK